MTAGAFVCGQTNEAGENKMQLLGEWIRVAENISWGGPVMTSLPLNQLGQSHCLFSRMANGNGRAPISESNKEELAMKRTSIIYLNIAALLTLCTVMPSALRGESLQDRNKADEKQSSEMKDEVEQAQKAAKVFGEIMDTPDKAIPKNMLDKAECILVFPDVIKAAFIVGGRGGNGVASCRTANGWSAPAFLNLGGGSIGWQIGAESTDYVLLVMNKDGINTMLKNNFELGAGASVAAGPVGREASASTDAALNAQMLSYSRTKGLFAGVALKGGVIETDNSDMRDAYGANVTAREVLLGNSVTAPAGVRVFPEALARYSTRASSGRTQ
jgi:lipid-binding SYLF domain-containing protein